MIKVNSLSGGKTSSYMAVHFPADYEVFSVVCIDDRECTPKDAALVQYANNKLEKYAGQYGEFIATAEDDATLAAMMDLEQILGREIIWVRGKSYDQIINERYERTKLGFKQRLPSWARRWCTEQLKLEPIFYWWFANIGIKCEMRLGFRFDEFYRVENLINNPYASQFKIPINCSTQGQRLQRHQLFTWRNCSLPLVKNGVTSEHVNEYWDKNKAIFKNTCNLFYPRTKIEFPVVSNCVGCFHKKAETLAAMSILHPEKMQWFANQELKNMGTWLDSKETYQSIIDNAPDTAKEVLYEIKYIGQSCDSGGCTD